MNSLKEKTEQLYLEGKYSEAIKNYQRLIVDYKINDEKAVLNLAHSLYKNKIYTEASSYYKKLENSDNNKIRSIANLQLGIIAAKKSHKKALTYFENALKADPYNEIARFNYELLKKFIKNHKSGSSKKKTNSGKTKATDNAIDNADEDGLFIPLPSPQDQGQKNEGKKSNSSNSENSGLSQSEGKAPKNFPAPQGNVQSKSLNEAGTKNSQALLSNRLKEINLSLERAKLIMETFEKQEVQYIQQLKKKKTDTDRYLNKPDY